MKLQMMASLPPIQSAISVDGSGDGARIKFDISRDSVPEVLKLVLMTGKPLKMTIETEEESEG